jgi:hypothetical protein
MSFKWLLIALILMPSISVQVYAVAEEPPKMLGQKMIYDPINKTIILFGGSYYSGHYTFYGDTWSLETAKDTWTKLQTTGSPNARFNAGMVYDSDHKKIILFGGFSASDRIGDTWTYDVATKTWVNMYPSTSPSRRSDMGIAYDEGAKKIVIFGGYGLNDRIQGDTWVYDVEANMWTQKTPVNHPTARYGGVMVYDSYTKKTLLFGGHLEDQNGKDLGYENEIWAYDYSGDNWEKITTQNKPPARYWHDLAYNPEGQKIILFGGSQGGGNDLGDTWIYSCKDKSWSKVASIENPDMRSQPSLAYDSSIKSTVMFGGADFKAQGDFLYYNDVWVLSQDSQWKKLTADTLPPTPVNPPEFSIPGFGPIELCVGLVLASVVLLARKYFRLIIYNGN